MWLNQNHPERKSDEILLTNIGYISELDGTIWNNPRIGKVALGSDGNPCRGNPVFIKIGEYKTYLSTLTEKSRNQFIKELLEIGIDVDGY